MFVFHMWLCSLESGILELTRVLVQVRPMVSPATLLQQIKCLSLATPDPIVRSRGWQLIEQVRLCREHRAV